MRNRCLVLIVALVFGGLLTFGTPAQADDLKMAQNLLQSQDFSAAAEVFEKVTAADPKNGDAWFGLAQALQGGKKHKQALKAYEKAIELGARTNRAYFHGARALAAQGKKKEAVEWLDRLAATGAAPYQAVASHPDFQPMAEDDGFKAVLAKMQPCAGEAYRHFDFWVGEWDVTTATSQGSSYNKISAREGGCVVHEEYKAGAFTGTSLNYFDKASGTWNQLWLDNRGSVLKLQGKLEDGKMVLYSDREQSPINRVTWTPNKNGTVRQHWETSQDGGKTWTTAFDGTYTRRKS